MERYKPAEQKAILSIKYVRVVLIQLSGQKENSEMEDFTTGKVGAAIGEHSWEKPYRFNRGNFHAMASSSSPKTLPQFTINVTASAQATYHDNQMIWHPISQPALMNPINVPSATSANLGHINVNADMDPKKLKRIMANRESAKRSRLRWIQHDAELKSQAEKLEAQIASFHPQIETYTNEKKLLTEEQSSLKLQLSNLEKENMRKEAEIQKNKAEIRRLEELQRKQDEEFQALASILTWDEYQLLMFNSNSNNSGLEQIGYTNSNQGAENADQAFQTEVDALPKQHEIMHGWEAEQELTGSSGLEISEQHKQRNLDTNEVHEMMNQMVDNNPLDSGSYFPFK